MNEAEEFLQDNDCVDIPISYWSTEEVKYVSELMQSYADEQLKKNKPSNEEITKLLKVIEGCRYNNDYEGQFNYTRNFILKILKQ